MTSSYRFPRPLLVFLGLLALIAIAHPRRASATEMTCYDQYGLVRQCTATEKYGECLYAATDSFEQCKADQPWYTEGACYLAKFADDAVCDVQFVEGVVLPPIG